MIDMLARVGLVRWLYGGVVLDRLLAAVSLAKTTLPSLRLSSAPIRLQAWGKDNLCPVKNSYQSHLDCSRKSQRRFQHALPPFRSLNPSE